MGTVVQELRIVTEALLLPGLPGFGQTPSAQSVESHCLEFRPHHLTTQAMDSGLSRRKVDAGHPREPVIQLDLLSMGAARYQDMAVMYQTERPDLLGTIVARYQAATAMYQIERSNPSKMVGLRFRAVAATSKIQRSNLLKVAVTTVKVPQCCTRVARHCLM
jgi:hypothetical protein